MEERSERDGISHLFLHGSGAAYFSVKLVVLTMRVVDQTSFGDLTVGSCLKERGLEEFIERDLAVTVFVEGVETFLKLVLVDLRFGVTFSGLNELVSEFLALIFLEDSIVVGIESLEDAFTDTLELFFGKRH